MLAFAKEQHPDGELLVIPVQLETKQNRAAKAWAKQLVNMPMWRFLTSDDPNFEDPKKIADEIKQSIKNDHVRVQFEVIVKSHQRGDSAGWAKGRHHFSRKGTDKYMTVNGEDLPYEGDYHLAEEFIKD